MCARPTAADCIRAVYRGAPEDYAQVADISAGALLTPDADGRYHVERGQQVTVVTAAPLPEGWTRFYLDRTPLGTPSPVSSEQLIAPVGTTYTFTVTGDEAASTLISFDLKAARPFVRPRPDGKPEIGAAVVTTVFSVVSCESGFAVTDPDANAELVEDCEALLRLRDTLAGDAALNWSAGAAMTGWTGVTVGGTPQRVTGLNLENSGLNGVLSGLVGNLTGLTELRLNGNALTGMIPSKVALLTGLTHVYLAGNAFTGCVPPSLRAVANSDIATLGLSDCGTPTDVSYGDSTMTNGTYQFIWEAGDSPLIFDVPAGVRLEVDWIVLEGPVRDGDAVPLSSGVGLLLGVVDGRSWIGLDMYLANEWNRFVPLPSGGSTDRTAGADPDLGALFDLIVQSAWLGTAE